MKTNNASNYVAVKNILEYLNHGHDAILKKIEFIKKRDVDEKDGSIIFPFSNIKDMIKCDIKIELIHNSYEGSKINQIILLEFKEVSNFNFYQKSNFDYSDIYKITSNKDNEVNFSFFATKEEIKVLEIFCKEIFLYEY